MDFALSPDLREFKARARAFAETVLYPLEIACDEQDGLPPEVELAARRAALATGFFAPNVPVEDGGAGLGIFEQVMVEEGIGGATGMLWALVWRPSNVLMQATAEQRERYLRPWARGERRGCYAITEPGAGSDTGLLAATARREGDGFRISGEKWFATGGDVASFFMVVANVVDDDDGDPRPTIFFVDRAAPGLRFVREPRFTHASVYGHPVLHFEDVRVTQDDILGDVGLGMELTRDWFREERLMIAARCLGAAERALTLALEWARERQAGGKPLIEHQSIGNMLADSATELAAARALTYKIAWEIDNGLDIREAHGKAAMVKLFASEMAGRVCDRAVQILGGRGYMREHPVERLWRDTRVDRIWEGTSEIQRLIIARGLARRGVATLTG
jgi:butyryl-CoA dehydrogenase